MGLSGHLEQALQQHLIFLFYLSRSRIFSSTLALAIIFSYRRAEGVEETSRE